MASVDRRGFVTLAGSAAAAAALPPAFARPVRPNILFIMADDLGYADLSCYGRRDFSTPRIDRLAREGVRFVQAYSNSPVCSATRAALMTGRYQHRLRVGLEEPLRDTPGIGLPPEHPTLPSLLRAAGYRTALVGKWHLGALPEFGPLQSGYETFFGFRSGAVDYYTHVGNSGAADLWDGDVRVERSGYLTELLGRRAVGVLESFARQRAPFFLSLHFNAPHWPWEAPGDEAESRRLAGKSLNHFDGGSARTYRRMIESMDTEVGRVLDTLARSGLARDTLVVFTSDNGGERFSDNWPFTGRKSELLEGGIRVPALLRWPRRFRAEQTSEQVMITMDWMPTLLAAAGVAADAAYPPDGLDLLPLIESGERLSRTLYWRFKSNAQRAVREGDYKFLTIHENSFLFNVVEDPMERANLRDLDRASFDRLARQWEQWNGGMLADVPDSAIAGPRPADVPDRYVPQHKP
jgi:arylsulfatase A-like enzyme